MQYYHNNKNRTCQAPLSMEFFRQEYWSGQPFPPPGDLPNLGIEPVLQADSLPSEPPGKPQQKTAYTTNDNLFGDLQMSKILPSY